MAAITVFTPTYNRAYCLHRCYESLCRQSCKDFVWLIIDDGSTDQTKDIVEGWQRAENGFEIVYLYKENGGMHNGYNCAYARIDTELSINVDSDDYLTDTAIEELLAFWREHQREDIGGIYALDRFEDGRIVGLPFPDDLKEFKGWGYKEVHYVGTDGKKKVFHNRGDKKFIGVTAAINRYPPIPEFPGEKYYSLYYKQHRIERDNAILVYNRPVCVVEYQEDGSTNHMLSQYVRNPKGFCDERKFVLEYAPTLRLRANAAIHYVAESLLAGDWAFFSHTPRKGLTLLCAPMGLALYLWIRRRTKT